MKRILFTAVCISLLFKVNAQEQEETAANAFQGTRFVNEQSVNLADHGELRLYIQHRFGEIDGGIYQLFGLDQATLRMGFEYGLGENLNVGFGRSTYLKTYDVYGKMKFASQTESFPVTVAAVAAGSVPTQRNYFPDANVGFSDKLSGNVQLLVAKTINNVGFQVSPGFLSTGYLLSENQSISMFTLGLAGSVKVSSKVSANVEYLPHFHSEYSATNPLSLGVDIDTGGHIFQLILSNSQQFITQSLHTATGGSWGDGELFFGFNLIREFRIKYY